MKASQSAGENVSVALLAIWFLLTVWASLPGDVAGKAIAGAIQYFAMVGFVAAHAAVSLGWRGMLVYLGVGTLIAFAMEALSIATGFPFGFFEHHAPIPKLLGVPINVPLAYPTLGWLAWTMARLILRSDPARPKGRLAVSLLAALILTGYDICFDAIGSAVLGMWSFRHPSGLLGVPLSNFLGWILTGFTIFAAWAFIEPHRGAGRESEAGAAHMLLPSLFWAALVVQYALSYLSAPDGTVAIGTRSFVIADIYETALICSLLVLAPPALAAGARVSFREGRAWCSRQ